MPHLINFFVYIFGWLGSVGHSFAYVAYFVLLRDVWIRTERVAVASRRATKIATHLLFIGGLEYLGHSFACVAHFVFLKDVWIRTQRAAAEVGALPT
jgi:hypothetical protein